MADKSVKIDIIGEDNTSKAFKSASASASKFGTTVKGESGKAKEALESVSKIAAGVFAGNALAEGFEKAFDFVKDGVKEAADFEQGFSGIKTAMKNAKVPDDVIEAQERFITGMSNSVGVSKEDLLPAYQKLFLATGNVGDAQKALGDALDLSKAAHIPLTAATKALANGYAGNTAALRKYGIEVDKGAKGVKILADVQGKVKGAAQAATQGAAGQYQKLQVNLANMREEVGEKLLPVLTQFASKITTQVLPKAEEFAKQFIDGFGKTVSWVKQNSGWVEPLAAGILGIIAAYKIWKTTTEVMMAVQAAFNVVLDANPIGLIVLAIAGIVAGLVVFFTKTKLGKQIWSDFTSFMTTSVTQVKAFFTDALPAAFLVFKSAAEGALGTILVSVGKLIGGFGSMLAVLGKVPGFGWAKDAAAAVQGASDKVTNLGTSLRTTSSKDMVAATAKAKAFTAAVKGVPKSAVTTAQAKVDAAQKNLDLLKSKIKSVPPSKRTTLNAEIAQATRNLNATKANLAAIKSKTVSVSVSAPKSVTIPIRTTTIQVTTSEGVGVMTMGSRTIRLAKGGIVTKPTFALVGEDGPEAVLPLTAKNAPAYATAAQPVNVYVTPLIGGLDIRDIVRIEIEQNGKRQALDLSGGMARR